MSLASTGAEASAARHSLPDVWADPVINLDAVRAADVSRDPYTYMLASDTLSHGAVPALRAEFPHITKPGFLTVDEVSLKGRFKQLVDEIESPEFSEVMSQKMGLDLHPYPRLTTIRKLSQLRDGPPHVDGKSKIMTVLFYLNDEWGDNGAGRLRVLYGPKAFEPYKVEVPPTMGTMFAFLRSETSWHGHPPFAGERKVVQTAWIRDQHEVERKKKRNATAQFLKGIFGR